LLLKVLRTGTDNDIVGAAFNSCARLWGKDSLEPHYHVIQNPEAEYLLDSHEATENVVKTVAEKGDALRIMEVFPKCVPEVQEPLEAALLTRPTLPVKEAAAALSHADEGTVRLATGLIGKVKEPDAAVKKAVGEALARWWQTWQDRRAKVDRVDDGEQSLEKASGVVEILLWTAGRVGVPATVLADVAKSRADDPRAKSIRLEAIRCLSSGKPTAATFETLEQLALGNDADVRVLATELVARLDPKRAAGLAEKTLSDRPSFERLVAAKAVSASKLGPVAAQVHYQPVVLPVLIAAKDVAPLAAVARDKKAADAARLGAVEGLGVMATEAAEKVLSEIGGEKGEDKELRKAAFRALRRSKRARRKASA
jgi:ParB family chromosome partitioning protein